MNEISRARKILIAFVAALTFFAMMLSACNRQGDEFGSQTIRYSQFDSIRVQHDLYVEGAATIDGAIAHNGALDVDGATTLNSTLDVDGATTLNSTLDVDGNLTSGTGAVTVTDNVLIDGAADAIQLLVQGNATQTSNMFVIEQSDGTDKFTVSNAGNTVIAGTSDLQGNVSDSGGALTFADNTLVDGQADAVQLTAQGYTTQTNSIFVVENSGGTDLFTVSNAGNIAAIGDSALGNAADDTVTITGDVTLDGKPDTDTANYNYWLYINGDMTGTGTKDRNYGILIEMTRPAGQEVGSGDFDEAGLKIRVDTEAITTTTGTVLRGMDVEAKADNPGGTVTNLYGAALTAKSDTSAGGVDTMIGLTTNAQNNAAVTTTLMSADFRLMRQAATEPTNEYVIRVRNSSTTGTGADAGIYLSSDASGGTDDMDYGIDMSAADMNTADIRLSNGETIANTTDGVMVFGGAFAFAEGTTQDLASSGTITSVATYQPITTSEGGACTLSATTSIADGLVTGQLIIITNEDAQDIVIKDGANTILSGDITLTGGAQDTITLIWDGTNWVGVAFVDN